MFSQLLFVGPIFVIFAAYGVASSSINSTDYIHNPAGQCNKPPISNCNCHCTVNQNTHGIIAAVKALERKLENFIAHVNETKPPNKPAALISSCKEQYEIDNSSKSQVYELMFRSRRIPVYCHMGDFGCGIGGWTLALKTNGSMRTFHYNSHLWTDKNPYNLAAGQTGFDMQETKLPTYWDTPFTKICLGMRTGKKLNFVVLDKQASSLYSLIADGNYKATSLGRYTWKNLIGPEASLQANCNREGFNVECSSRFHAKARIGILGNQQRFCSTCDSRIGFGTGGLYDDSNTCGNEAHRTSDNGAKHIKAMGYVLVQ